MSAFIKRASALFPREIVGMWVMVNIQGDRNGNPFPNDDKDQMGRVGQVGRVLEPNAVPTKVLFKDGVVDYIWSRNLLVSPRTCSRCKDQPVWDESDYICSTCRSGLARASSS